MFIQNSLHRRFACSLVLANSWTLSSFLSHMKGSRKLTALSGSASLARLAGLVCRKMFGLAGGLKRISRSWCSISRDSGKCIFCIHFIKKLLQFFLILIISTKVIKFPDCKHVREM